MDAGTPVGGRFVVEQRVAAGGMGVVHRARDRETGEPIAVKVLGRDVFDDARFAREAELLAELRHPGIVRYVAHGREPDGAAWLAMEWLEGEDLGARIGRAGLRVEETVRLVARVAEALASAHARGIVHRDVKPRNVFLVDGSLERPKLLDFGIARAGFSAASLTRSGTIVGTPGYMAPEQIRSDRALDARVDVFALGCVLFECLTGRPAFEADHPMAVLAKIALGDVSRVAQVRSDVPASLDALVARMLASDPDLRPADGAAVAAALSALDATGAPPSVGSSTVLGAAERRLVSVVLAHVPHGLRAEGTVITGGAPGESAPPPAEVDVGALRREIEAQGGSLELLSAGSFVVRLHGVGAATDQAARAARCALRVRELLPRAAIALATGRGELHQKTSASEPIERAALAIRTTDAGPSSERHVRVDDVTAGLLDARFDVSGDERGLVLRGARDEPETSRTLLGRETPCVGRDRELRTIVELYDDCVEEQAPRVALVIAEPGMGKSRLSAEALRAIRARPDAPEPWIARGDALVAGSPYALVGDAIRRLAGIRDGEPDAVRLRKLRARVARNVAKDQVRRVTELLGEIARAPTPNEDAGPELRAARRDATRMNEGIRDAFRTFVAREAEGAPVVLVLEDLHWGDLPSVKLLDATLRDLDDRPIFLLSLARPEVHEHFPRLWSARRLHELRLRELSRRAADALVREVLGERATDALVERIVTRASGNAFFLEELVRAVAEGGGDALPDTIVAVVQARVEALEPEARRVLRAASVLGETFWTSGVAALLDVASRPREVRAWLEELEGRELVSRRPTSRFSGETEWAFRHALLRDAAYAMLTDDDRRLGHRLAADWLERAGERDAFVLAEHAERGGANERAIGWFRRAAKQSFEGNDLASAIARAERGVACGAAGEVLASLRLIQSEAHSWHDALADAERCARDAMAAVPEGSPLWWRAAGDAINFGGLAGHRDRVVELADRMRGLPWSAEPSIAQAFGASFATCILFNTGDVALSRALVERLVAIEGLAAKSPVVAGWVRLACYMRARFGARDDAGMLAHASAASASFDRVGELRARSWGTIALGWALSSIGCHARAEAVLREAVRDAERIGLPWARCWAQTYLGRVLVDRDDPSGARAVLAEAVSGFEAGGNVLYGGIARTELARVLRRVGDARAAERLASQALEMLAPFAAWRPLARGVLARARLALEDLEGARAALVGAEAELALPGLLDEAETSLRLALVEVRRDPIEAAALARDLLVRADRIDDAETRRAFLEGVEEHARALAIARRR